MIYIACPYTHHDPAVMKARYEGARRYLAEKLLLCNGQIFYYSPIVHCHELALAHDLPKDSHFWWDYNKASLSLAEVIEVLQLPGWENSVGIFRELGFAEAKQITAFYVEGAEYYNGPELS